jgi:branched-chain amino acid transport system permease protein
MEFFVAQILTGLANASSLFLVACGLSLIFGVTRIVNFAHGSLYMLGAYIGLTLMEALPGHVGFWGSILLAGIAVGLIGVVIEMLVLRPVYRAPELFQLVATFGVILVDPGPRPDDLGAGRSTRPARTRAARRLPDHGRADPEI